MLSKEMLDFICDHEKEAYDLLLSLARIPAPLNHEEKRAQFCARWLKEQGAEGVYIDEALNVVYPVDAEGDGPLEVYMAHTDVVFSDTQELPLKVEDGRIYCPGIGDDTACLVCLLLTAKFIAESIQNGTWRRKRGEGKPGLLLVCNSGEEGLGNLKGVKEICRRYKERMTEFVTFDSQLDKIVDRAVGSKRYAVTIRTRGGHSYNAFGNDNAIEKLAGVIGELYAVPVPEEGKTTYNVGLISGGTSVNTIAQEATMLYEFRSDLAEGLAYMEKAFEAVLEGAKKRGIDISCELLGLRPCAGELDEGKQQKLVARAMRAVEGVTGRSPVLEPGSTDCNIPLSLGIPSVCIGSFRGAGAHTREEYVEISSLREGYETAFEMILGNR